MSNVLDSIVKRALDDWKKHCDWLHSNSPVNINESREEQEKRKSKAKKSYSYFFMTYLSMYADSECADFQVDFAHDVRDKPNNIAIAEWHREAAKSVHCDIGIPMWLKIQNELTGMILMGKNETDACNLLSDVQAQFQHNQLYIHDWGEQFSFGDWQTGDFTTKDGIRFLAVGRDQSPRGARKGEKRPNYASIDDIDDDELVNNLKRVLKIVKRIFGALFFALSTKRWRMVVAGNRIHAQSVLAHVVGDVKPGAPKRKNIIHSKIYAIDPKTGQPSWHQRYTLEEIQAKIDAAGPTLARREFFHENHVEGSIFKDSYIQWKKMPKGTWKNYKVIIGYCDPSFENKETSDFKAVSVWALLGQEKHCLKRFVQRTDMMQVFMFMSDFEDQLPEGVGVIWYIEEQFFNRPIQDALQQHNELRASAGKSPLYIIVDQRKKENKYTRMVRMEPSYTLRKVYYNIDEMHNADMIEGNNQLKGIEPGYHTPDDSPDSDEGAWHHLEMHIEGRATTGRTGKVNKEKGW